MFDFLRNSLRSRLSFFIALLVMLASATIGVLAFDAAESALFEAAIARVKAISESRAEHIVTVLRMRTWQAAQVSTKSSLIELLKSGNSGSLGQQVNAELVQTVELGHWQTLSAVASTGAILASSDPALVGTDVKAQSWFGDGLAGVTVGDLRKATNDEIVYRVTMPVREPQTGRVLGMVLGSAPAALIRALLLEATGLGSTGESYLVDDTGLMLTPSRFTAGAELATHIKSDVAADVARGAERSARWNDYRHHDVIGAISSQEIRKMGVPWSLITEMDADEALDGAFALRTRVAIIALVCIALAIAVGMRISMSLVRPIAELAAAAKRIGEGDLSTVLVQDESRDEVGVLREAFRAMTQNLRKMLGDVQAGVKLLTSSVSEIAASAKQASASASEQASIASQVSTTADELKRTSEAAKERAQHVVEDAESAMQTGKRGAHAVTDAVEVMGVIDTRVQDVAGKNRRLGEQSGQLVEIIDTVQGLAEQSNLLAVNASIEAAKAGEQGRGFSVVAAEVRRLAEQSKRATLQVRRTLIEIQKSAEDAATTTADGATRVAEGTRAMQAVRGVFDDISGALEESAERSRQIAETSRQQAAGVEQIAQAMVSLSQAGHEAAAMASQLEHSADKLRSLGLGLRELTSRYQLADEPRAVG